jgi:hypothetical protein
MGGYMRIVLTAGVLALGLALTACEDFDPTAIFDVFDTKKKLAGERQPVFPEGTPGVPQGVPPEMVKGYQAPPEQPKEAAAAAAEQAQAKPKPKPKPKVVAKPQEPSSTGSVKPPQAGAQASAAPPNQQQTQDAPAGSAWPSAPQPSGGIAWPAPPAQR